MKSMRKVNLPDSYQFDRYGTLRRESKHRLSTEMKQQQQQEEKK